MTESEKWLTVESFFEKNLTEGEKPNLDTMLFLIGIQELGKGKIKLKKDDKLNVFHIAVCRLLEPFGFYQFSGFDAEGWPTYDLIEELPHLQPNEQQLLMKKAIVNYFEEEGLVHFL